MVQCDFADFGLADFNMGSQQRGGLVGALALHGHG